MWHQAGNQTQGTIKGAKCSHHYTNPPPPLPKLPLSRFSISKGVLQDNLVLLTVFPDCFSYFSLSFCHKMYHCCKEKLPSDHCWNWKGLRYMWIAPTPDQAAPDWLGLYHVGMELLVLLRPFQRGLSNQPINPLTPRSDQGRISPYNINTISSIEVMRIK